MIMKYSGSFLEGLTVTRIYVIMFQSFFASFKSILEILFTPDLWKIGRRALVQNSDTNETRSRNVSIFNQENSSVISKWVEPRTTIVARLEERAGTVTLLLFFLFFLFLISLRETDILT